MRHEHMATLWLLGGSPTNYGGSKNNRSTQHVVRLHHCDEHATTRTDYGSIFVRSSSSYIMFCSVQVCELMISSFKYLATKEAQRSASGYQSSGVVSASMNALGNEEFLISRLVSSVAKGVREEVGAGKKRGKETSLVNLPNSDKNRVPRPCLHTSTNREEWGVTLT